MTPTRRWSLLLLILLLCLSVSAQRSRILRVPQSYRTIQSAVEATRVGDTVLIDHGVYYENVRISKNIVLSSQFILDRDTSHVSRTIIDGSKARDKRKASVVTISGPTDTNCTVTGLTIRGGSGSTVRYPGDPNNEWWVNGGGIIVLDAGARIVDNVIADNAVQPVGTVDLTAGGGIATANTVTGDVGTRTCLVERNTITRNTVTGRWAEAAGIGVDQPAVIRQNVITHNRAHARQRSVGGGLGVYLTSTHDITIESNFIHHNNAGLAGGVVVGTPGTHAGRAIIVNNIIAENSALESSGGVNVAERSKAIFINNTIVGNRCGSHGGGVNVPYEATATLVNNILWGNGAEQVSALSQVRADHNLIQGGYPGIDNFDANPLFAPGDTLYRLLPGSPAIGRGTTRFYRGGIRILPPAHDLLQQARPAPPHSRPDLGAVEALAGTPSERSEAPRSHLRLCLELRQVSGPVFRYDSLELIQAGHLTARVLEYDTVEHRIDSASGELQFSMPPGGNFLAVEFLARGRDSVRRLYGLFSLNGIDQVTNVLLASQEFAYRQYVDLPPGEYSLTFQAADEVGFLDRSNRHSVRIVVLPFWYQRWWAYGLAALFVAGAFAYVYSREMARFKRERKLQQQFTRMQLDGQEAERKRLASELHDGLGQNLLIAKSELQPLVDQPSGAPDGVRQASLLIQESIQTVREMSSNLHPHQLERLGFCSAVTSMVEQFSHSNHLAVHCSCEDVDRFLSKESQLQAYRIIQEALANILRHASARKATVDVRKETTGIIAVVADDGVGFSVHNERTESSSRTADEKSRGFGLASMAQRARIAGGTLKIDSMPGKGTTITVSIPYS